jgi:hypothetical protein
MSAGSRSLEDFSMRKALAIYHAPEGDSKEAEMAGVLFRDGEPVELNSDDHGHLIRKLPGNQHFEIEIGEDDAPPVEPETGIAKMKIDDLRKLATERGIDPEGMSKAELREALA